MSGLTGGIQGRQGTLFGIPYAAGSWVDKLIEAFGGSHDLIGGQLPGLYDEQGNTQRDRSDTEKIAHETWSAVAIVPSAAFAMAKLLPPEIWKAISILLGSAK
jgi:filamentous hemagglutinin